MKVTPEQYRQWADPANHHPVCTCSGCLAKRHQAREAAPVAPGCDFSPVGPDGKPISEAAFQAKVIELAVSLGWKRELIYHTYRSVRSQKGFLDLVLCRPPFKLLVLELKTDKAPKPPPEQEEWLAALPQCGVEAYLFRPRHWQDIVAVLSR